MLAAAILSGNIQQESGWHGQRAPWVLNDGAGTNKGLISWNRDRITNAERFLGKPLETASNSEQIKWIKEELRQYGLLEIFLNPNSTEQQLKDASYKYIGWGEVGDRWKYSRQIFASLQKGEVGTYKPGARTSVGSGDGTWRFGRTGHVDVAQGWSHAHFQSNSIVNLINDTIPLIKKMADSGLKPELSDTTPILSGKTREYYERLIRRGIALHTHDPGIRFDVNMKGFPLVPFSLRNIARNAGDAGNMATVPGSGNTQLLHMSTKPNGGYQKGGLVTQEKIKPLQDYPSYDDSEVTIMIQPIIIERTVPISSNNSRRIGFPGSSNGSVNRSNSRSNFSIR